MSQAARIRRGPAAQPRSRAVVTRPKSAARKAGNSAGRLLGALPLSPQFVRRVTRWGAWLIVAALVIGLAVAFQLPQMAGKAAGEAIGRAGFTVAKVETPGIGGGRQLALRSIVADQETSAMPLVDLDAIRNQALTLGWVKDVRVARRFPDTIVVDVDRRIAAAIWQNRQKLSLIDADGVVLETVALDRMPDLPLVIGPAANLQAAALTRLLDSAPTIKPMFAGATWIGGRRWDIRFQSGEVLALPEGEAASAKALAKFARMDSTAALLGKGLVRFDMRIPGKIYIRMSREPGKRIEVGELRSAI